VDRIVCFISDFGLGDEWVGVVHAVMMVRAPDVRIVDVSHAVAPYDVRGGAVVAASAVAQLPGLTHLVVVDPGVGGERRDVVIFTADGTVLVGPDNGVLVPAALRGGGIVSAYEIDAGLLGETEPAPTFHARDVLGPAAALLATGTPVTSLAEPLDVATLEPAPFAPAHREPPFLVSEVLDVDRFGSVRIGVTAADIDGVLEAGDPVEVSSGHTALHLTFGRTFSDVPEGQPVAMFDSTGWFTVSVNAGSAAERYGFLPRNPVRLRVRD
jgi:S-adenosyl-L-methionine hydrolase (adenosine-forming)